MARSFRRAKFIRHISATNQLAFTIAYAAFRRCVKTGKTYALGIETNSKTPSFLEPPRGKIGDTVRPMTMVARDLLPGL